MQPLSSSPQLLYCVPIYLHCVCQPYLTTFHAPSIPQTQRASTNFLLAEIYQKLSFHIRSPRLRPQAVYIQLFSDDICGPPLWSHIATCSLYGSHHFSLTFVNELR
ncbi:hypothetical protein HanIR_Chr13g0625071 [Helianthus annuus]|nr:hypothetical protein HanIR_Chr13g0625071 [Helianthus annuus]